MSKRLATILNIQQSKLQRTDNLNEVDSKQDMNQKANDLDKLAELMKENLRYQIRQKKIQILTLTAESWSSQQ